MASQEKDGDVEDLVFEDDRLRHAMASLGLLLWNIPALRPNADVRRAVVAAVFSVVSKDYDERSEAVQRAAHSEAMVAHLIAQQRASAENSAKERDELLRLASSSQRRGNVDSDGGEAATLVVAIPQALHAHPLGRRGSVTEDFARSASRRRNTSPATSSVESDHAHSPRGTGRDGPLGSAEPSMVASRVGPLQSTMSALSKSLVMEGTAVLGRVPSIRVPSRPPSDDAPLGSSEQRTLAQRRVVERHVRRECYIASGRIAQGVEQAMRKEFALLQSKVQQLQNQQRRWDSHMEASIMRERERWRAELAQSVIVEGDRQDREGDTAKRQIHVLQMELHDVRSAALEELRAVRLAGDEERRAWVRSRNENSPVNAARTAVCTSAPSAPSAPLTQITSATIPSDFEAVSFKISGLWAESLTEIAAWVLDMRAHWLAAAGAYSSILCEMHEKRNFSAPVTTRGPSFLCRRKSEENEAVGRLQRHRTWERFARERDNYVEQRRKLWEDTTRRTAVVPDQRRAQSMRGSAAVS